MYSHLPSNASWTSSSRVLPPPEPETRTINPHVLHDYPHKRPRLSEPTHTANAPIYSTSQLHPLSTHPSRASSPSTLQIDPVLYDTAPSTLPSPPPSRISRPSPPQPPPSQPPSSSFDWEDWITRRLDGTPATPSESYIQREDLLCEFPSRDNLRAALVLVQDAVEGAKARRAQAEEDLRDAQRRLMQADGDLVLLGSVQAWMGDELARPPTPKSFMKEEDEDEDLLPYTPVTPSEPPKSAPTSAKNPKSKPKRPRASRSHADPNRARVRSTLAPNGPSFIDVGTPEDLCAKYKALLLWGSYRKVTGEGRYRIWPPRRDEGGEESDDLVFVTPENVYEVPPHLSCPHCRTSKRFRKIPGSDFDLKALPRCLWLTDSNRPCCLICHRSSSHKSGGTNLCGADYDAVVKFKDIA
ncbi:unnamed protein product [Peniophora sp. CBMAI 1063]|nr:unnamed protein product [Peniophora sp. CBMAI 1063]